MPGNYSRLGYGAIVKETTENVAVQPSNFFGFTAENILTKWGVKASANIFADRNLMVNAIKNAITAPSGPIDIMIEPKQFGWFLEGVFGAPTAGVWFSIRLRLHTGTITGTPVAGAALSQATSGATGTVAVVVDSTHLDLRGITVGFDASHTVTGTNLDGTTFTFTPAATLTAGPFQVGETVTGATSSATAVVIAVSNENDYLLVGTIAGGPFTAAGELISGGTSSAKATLLANDPTVNGFEFKGPNDNPEQQTFSLEIGYQQEAIRFMGVRISDFKSIKDKDNIMTAQMSIFARSAFINARVTAVVASGSTKTIMLDQTLGLTTSDIVKVFRPGVGYLDFSGSGVKTSTISSIADNASISVATLQTSLRVGDLIVLAPQTPSYSVGKEFSWIGGTIGSVGQSIGEAVLAAGTGMETSDFSITNETEEVHAANGLSVKDRFPTANFFKGFKSTGKFKAYFQNSTFLDILRNSTETGICITHTGGQIGATGVDYQLSWRYANCVAKEFTTPVAEDNILTQDIPFEIFRSQADGYSVKVLLVTDTVSL